MHASNTATASHSGRIEGEDAGSRFCMIWPRTWTCAGCAAVGVDAGLAADATSAGTCAAGADAAERPYPAGRAGAVRGVDGTAGDSVCS